MTNLEKHLTSAIEKMHNEHLNQMQSLQRQVESLQKQVTSLTLAYNTVKKALDGG